MCKIPTAKLPIFGKTLELDLFDKKLFFNDQATIIEPYMLWKHAKGFYSGLHDVYLNGNSKKSILTVLNNFSITTRTNKCINTCCNLIVVKAEYFLSSVFRLAGNKSNFTTIINRISPFYGRWAVLNDCFKKLDSFPYPHPCTLL